MLDDEQTARFPQQKSGGSLSHASMDHAITIRKFTHLRIASWILAATIVGSALAMGSLHTRVLAILTVALAAAAFLAWKDAEPFSARPAATVLLLTGVGLTLWTL